MSVEQGLRELESIQRPFDHIFNIKVNDAYLIDNTFAFKINALFPDAPRAHVVFVADMRLKIIREKALLEGVRQSQQKLGIGALMLNFSAAQKVIYLGDKYKLSIQNDGTHFLLESANPINFEPVPENIDLKGLVAQRTSLTNI